MSKNSRFRGPFDNQHGNGPEPMFKSVWQHFDHINRSLPSQLSWKKSLFLQCQILGLLVNTLASDEKNPVFNRDNLTIPIQMQLSQKHKSFCEFFTEFFKYTSNFEHFDKKDDPYRFCISGITDSENVIIQCRKTLVSEDPSRRNMVNVATHCRNIHHSTFIIFIDHCQDNWFGKSLCFWHTKSWDWLLTHWHPMKRILFLIETI